MSAGSRRKKRPKNDSIAIMPGVARLVHFTETAQPQTRPRPTDQAMRSDRERMRGRWLRWARMRPMPCAAASTATGFWRSVISMESSSRVLRPGRARKAKGGGTHTPRLP